ncbi:MAG: FHA domain-containing protein [Lacipirellulaceae bacterium]
MKLVVLAGAKKDAVVPLKKDSFVIGRSSECSLRAASDAISRRHCEVLQTPDGPIARDLGSRNGTFVNDERLEGEQLLKHGDRLRVGPLEFRFELDADIAKAKQPKVSGVAEVLSREAKKGVDGSESKGFNESVDGWLIGPGAADPVQSLRETQSFRVDETKAMLSKLAEAPTKELIVQPAEDQETVEAPDAEAAKDDSKGGKGKKPAPGKLPEGMLKKPQAKDSREAAMQTLRDMARRR